FLAFTAPDHHLWLGLFHFKSHSLDSFLFCCLGVIQADPRRLSRNFERRPKGGNVVDGDRRYCFSDIRRTGSEIRTQHVPIPPAFLFGGEISHSGIAAVSGAHSTVSGTLP